LNGPSLVNSDDLAFYVSKSFKRLPMGEVKKVPFTRRNYTYTGLYRPEEFVGARIFAPMVRREQDVALEIRAGI
jgi:hypothetical protein